MWGFGLIVYHLVEGKPPFHGLSTEALYAAIVKDCRLDVNKLEAKETKEIFKKVFNDCVHANFRERPTAKQLLQDIAEERKAHVHVSATTLLEQLTDD